MANLPPHFLPDFSASAQSQTLFLPAPGKQGILATMTTPPTQKKRRFANPGAALAYCEKHQVNFVYFFPPPGSDHSDN